MFRVVIYVIISTLVSACAEANRQNPEVSKKISFGPVQISVKAGDTLINDNGIDSYGASLITSTGDTFQLEYGNLKIIDHGFDLPPVGFPIAEKEKYLRAYNELPKPDEIIFTVIPEEDNSQNIFDRNYYMYDTLADFIVKIIQPKRIGQGKTGIFIPEMRDGKSLSIYAENLDSIAHNNALRMLRTVRYK